MEVPIIKEIVVIFALSIGVLLVCHRWRVPPVVGFLVTGLLCGPHGLGLVNDTHDVENLATVGVVLLLFTVGMEFSFKNIIKYRYFFFGGGVLQLLITIGCCLGISRGILALSWAQAVFFGLMIVLSSTAIVLRVLDEKGESESRHGRFILGILIFQDIAAVLMLLLIPALSGTGEELSMDSVYHFLTGLALLLVISVIAFRGVPKLLYYVTRTRNRELFLLSLLTICFAVAWLTSSVGLSLSLGAFLAGLVVSESEYSHEAVGDVLPFQAIFTSFFFVSMGMLLDIGFVLQQPLLIILMAIIVLLLKSLIVVGIALVLKLPLQAAIISGVALSQIGEFSLVLAYSGMSFGLVSEYQYQLFLSVTLLTMGLTPLLMSLSPLLAQSIGRIPMIDRWMNYKGQGEAEADGSLTQKHIIIVGFGLRGKHMAYVAKEASVPYKILEMNPEVVEQERKKGEPIYYGDPSHRSVLIHAGIRMAGTLVIVIDHSSATLQIIKMAKMLNPDVYIITRTRYFTEVQQLFKAGANDVIPDEFGSSLEIFSRALQHQGTSQEQINKYVNQIRIDGYRALQLNYPTVFDPLHLAIDPETACMETLKISDSSTLNGKTILESALKKVYGLTILLIKRHDETHTFIDPEMKFRPADAVVVLGRPDDLSRARHLF